MKDQRTERLRQAIGKTASAAVEDQRAEAGLTTLSLCSANQHERHIWIDSNLAGQLVIDLENWSYQGTWDSMVAHLGASDEDVPKIVQAWLSGASVEECIRLGGRYISELQ
jgi:hypothetical protein